MSVVTMRRWARSGRLLPDHLTLGGHRRYDEDRLATVFHKNSRSLKVHAVAYARVAARDQAQDLKVQQQKLEKYCSEHF
ncbi:MAG: IS607 family transposase, partial [Proteobacteria bacterium]|nr:IS607 family transposase [Pseudomonadota bacterium]